MAAKFRPKLMVFFSACGGSSFGEYCLKQCDCQNGAKCEPVDGKCVCTKGWHGDKCKKRTFDL